MKLLQQLLGETPLESFLDKHFTRLPYSSLHGAKEFQHLLNWDRVQEVLEGKKSVLRIVKDGKVVKDYVDLSFEEAQKYYRDGCTLLLRFAERSSEVLNDLTRDFADSFHTDVDIQLYCTPEGHNAFGWHYDIEEVFIIQTMGSKEYTIRPNTVHPNPLVSSVPKDMGYEKEKSETKITVTLETGDWLYIPSGWWHVARTQKESMHVSIGLMPSSAVDILSFAPKFFAQLPFWRTRMPVHREFSSEEEEIQFYSDALRTLGKDLAQHLSSPEFIKNFLSFKKS